MGNRLSEDAAADLIENGEMRRHARKARQVYAERRALFAAEIDKTLGDIVCNRMPDGGIAFWLRYTGIEIERMEKSARAMGQRLASFRSFVARAGAARAQGT